MSFPIPDAALDDRLGADAALIARLESPVADREAECDAAERIAFLRAELSAAKGYLTNAMIDLETGCPKATALRTIRGGIARITKALP